MLTKIRENIFLGDEKITAKDIKENAITMVLVVAETINLSLGEKMPTMFYVNLKTDEVNKPHVKDIACHTTKYMVQNGETIAVIDKTGMSQAAFVVSRAICELESKSIYDVLTEIKELIPNFDIGKAYL